MAPIPPQLIGSSPAFLAILDKISRSAAMDLPVLLLGERGTGKRLMAGRLHFLSPRWEQSFIALNCAALTDAQLMDALLGDLREGVFERADNGTLCLLNIEQTGRRAQEHLISALDNGLIERPERGESITANVRIIATSGADLNALAASGEFSAGLLDKLSLDVITLPPLRQRTADIEPLAEHFGRKMASRLKADSFPGFTPEVLDALKAQNWPGNIRQLRTSVERAISNGLNDDGQLPSPISRLDLDPFASPWRLNPAAAPVTPAKADGQAQKEHIVETAPEAGFKDRVMNFERRLIDQALEQSEGHQGQAAESLDLTYHAFRGLLRKHGLVK